MTAEFYAAESTEKAQSMDARGFLEHCTLRVSEEDGRSRHVLPESSWAVVRRTTEIGLLDGRLTSLANEGTQSY